MNSVRQLFIQSRGYIFALSSSYVLMLSLIITQIILAPLYLAAFGQYQFGVLMTLLSMVNFVVIGINWMGSGCLRLLVEYASKGDDEQFAKTYGTVKFCFTAYGIFLAILGTGIALMLYGYIFTDGTDEDILAATQTLILISLYQIVLYPYSLDRITLTAQKRQGIANLSQIVGTLLFLATAIPWLLYAGTMAGIVVLLILSTIFSNLVALYFLRQKNANLKLQWPRRHSLEILKRLLGKTGGGFFLHGVFVLFLQADITIVSLLGGAKMAAEFYLVWKVAEAIVLTIWKIPEMMTPYFIHMDARGVRDKLKTAAIGCYIFVVIMALSASLLYGFFGQQIVTIWVGEENAPVSMTPYILASGAIFWLSISRLPTVFASAKLILQKLNIACGYEFFLKFIVMLIFIPSEGYIAALASINIAHIFGGFILYFYLFKNTLKSIVKDG